MDNGSAAHCFKSQLFREKTKKTAASRLSFALQQRSNDQTAVPFQRSILVHWQTESYFASSQGSFWASFASFAFLAFSWASLRSFITLMMENRTRAVSRNWMIA